MTIINNVAAAIREAMDEQIAHSSGGRCDDQYLAKAAIAVVLKDLHKLDPADDWQSLTAAIEWYARENGVNLDE